MSGVVMERRKAQKVSMGAKGADVFAELGFEDAEAAELRRKSELMTHLRQYMQRNELTQARAAQVFGVSQPRVSALINGKLSLFSLDELIRMYDSTGSRVRLVFEENVRRESTVLGQVIKTGLGAVAALKKAAGHVAERAASGSFRSKEVTRPIGAKKRKQPRAT